jgi:hypothetical protein
VGGEKKSFQLELSSDGGKLSGKAHSETGVLDLRDLKLSGKRLSFSLEVPVKDRKVPMMVECELRDDEVLSGKFTGQDGATGEFTARKPLAL